MKNQNNQRLQTVLLAAIAAIFIFGVFGSTFAQGIGAKYGSRDPQICADAKAPTKGAMTAALATKYVICAQEHISGEYLHLVDDVIVQVGGGVPYEPRNFPNRADIAPKSTVYPLRISFKSYMCSAISAAVIKGHNCAVSERPKATGFCTKTTFGDWYCNASSSDTAENWEYRVPPPDGAKAEATDAKVKLTAVAKTDANENKDENGFVKPDFSELEKYYEIIRYEYNVENRKLSIVAKMTKETNPNEFLVGFYDADGANFETWRLLWKVGNSRTPGEVHKFEADLPTEKEMKQVKKVVITRKL